MIIIIRDPIVREGPRPVRRFFCVGLSDKLDGNPQKLDISDYSLHVSALQFNVTSDPSEAIQPASPAINTRNF